MNTDTSRPPVRSPRRERTDTTRELLLRTAERLYAEYGLSEVSNRQVAEAAGSANNSAVAYHVGTKRELIDAISRSHAEPIGERMRRMISFFGGSTDPRDHVACLVRPYTDHLAELGTPSWCARFAAQTTTDPTCCDDRFFDATLTPLVRGAFDAMLASVPPIPDEVAALRNQMMRLVVVHTCAEQERMSAHSGAATDWALVGDGLVDAVTGVLLAPVGAHPAQ